ncbi:MAG TPA: ABC transporter permease [Acidimicrobiia bacterium]|nr:ABC transporter permease [Acidimicrobiia bacterium]
MTKASHENQSAGTTVIDDAAVAAPVTGADTPSGERVRRGFWGRWGMTEQRVYVAISVIGFLTVWEVASQLGWIRPLFFSSPTAVFAAAIREITGPNFWNNLRVSMLAFSIGFSLAIALSIPLGLMFGWFRRLGHFFDPWLRFFYATPRITYIPLLVLWFGLGLESKIALVFAGPFITILVGTLEGVRTVPTTYLDVARSYGAKQFQFFKSVLLPTTVPFILAATRLAVGIGIVAIVLGEMYASQAGIGHMLMQAAHNLQADRVLFAVLLLTILGVGLSKILLAIENRVADWKPQT